MGDYAAFLGVSFLVIATPGQDTLLTVRNTLRSGRRAGVLTALGVVSGQLIWTLAASAGIATLLIASEPAFRALRLAGVLYLLCLGGVALLNALRGQKPSGDDTASPPERAGAAYRQGIISNLSNPKVAIFFTSLLPQFARGDLPPLLKMTMLGIIFATMTLAWLTGYAFVVERAGNLLRRGYARRVLDAVMGVALLAFGWRLARVER